MKKKRRAIVVEVLNEEKVRSIQTAAAKYTFIIIFCISPLPAAAISTSSAWNKKNDWLCFSYIGTTFILVLCHICTNWLYMRALLQLSWLCGNSWIKSVQKIDKLDCELYKYNFEFIFSVLHEIFIVMDSRLKKVYYLTCIFTAFQFFRVEMVSKEHVS